MNKYKISNVKTFEYTKIISIVQFTIGESLWKKK